MSALATYSRERGIGRIGLRSPANGNAIGRVLANDLKCAVESCLVDRGVRVILVEADGRNFCVGGDITAFDAPVDERRTSIRQITSDFHAAMELMLSSDRPVITAVQGTAAGAGMSLAVAGDIVIAAEDARFVPAFTAIGLSADGGTTWLLPRLIGVRRSAELLLTNRHLDARQAGF
jgi:2-(1,2-epoxy-1,2-dihydrophenyl)acetyl-CoA isomerase